MARKSSSPHIAHYCETFQRACRESPRGSVLGEVWRPTLHLDSQVAVANRIAARIRKRMGIILKGPLAPSAFMTVLLRRDIRIPDQAEIVFVNSLPELLLVDPVPAYYPYPLKAVVKTFSKAIIQYFATGKAPRIRKILSVEMVNPRPAN